MSIQLLGPGQDINLTKTAPGIKTIGVALGWDANESKVEYSYDMDVSVFMLDDRDQVPREGNIVFYNNLESSDGAVKHTGDSTTGAGDGDNETLIINFEKLSKRIESMFFVLTIYAADKRNQSFDDIKNAFIRIYDYETKLEIARYDVAATPEGITALEFGGLFEDDKQQWFFKTALTGYKAGLPKFLTEYAPGISINTEKGAKLEPSKSFPLTFSDGKSYDEVCIGLNWSNLPPVKHWQPWKSPEYPDPVDLDVSAILFDGEDTAKDVVFYKPDSLKSQNKAVMHSGDELSGDIQKVDDLDNEIITIDLKRLTDTILKTQEGPNNPHIKQIFIILTSNQYDFGAIPNATLRLYEGRLGDIRKTLARFDVAQNSKFDGFYGMIMGLIRLKEDKGYWEFVAIGQPAREKDLKEPAKDPQRILNIAQRIEYLLLRDRSALNL